MLAALYGRLAIRYGAVRGGSMIVHKVGGAQTFIIL